jgi:citrate lyase beta subunit
MHAKAAASAADVIMLDLEDSVPLDAKPAARAQVITSITQLDWHNKVLTVRINGLDTPFGYRDLLEIGEAAPTQLDAVVIPKVNDAGDIHFVDRMLAGVEMHSASDHTIGIEASIETAQGLAQVNSIASASKRLKALVFGIADYSASVGARLISISGHGEMEEQIYPGHRWHFAISRMVMAAKARGMLAIDAPYGNFQDTDGLRRSAAIACALGCDGKWAIHPAQIDTINRTFTPSLEEIERAAKVLAAFQQADANQRGAMAVEGRMVDQATLRLARRLYAQAQDLGLAPEGYTQK